MVLLVLFECGARLREVEVEQHRKIAVWRRHRGVRGDRPFVGGPGLGHPTEPAIRDSQAVVSLRACRILAQRRVEFSDSLLITPGLERRARDFELRRDLRRNWTLRRGRLRIRSPRDSGPG